MTDSLIECRGVSKTYESDALPVVALHAVDVTIERAEFTALCGPSGSGKTTLLNLIGGLDTPTSGQIRVAGNDLTRMNRGELTAFRLQNIGFVFQAYNLVPVLSAEENVSFVMKQRGVPAAEQRERARKVLAEVGLAGMESRRPGALSGGQQQRVAVARAIVGQPQIVLADEPTANLDSKSAESLLTLMRRINIELGITFVFSTHDRLVMEFAQRIVTLRDGAIVEDVARTPVASSGSVLI